MNEGNPLLSSRDSSSMMIQSNTEDALPFLHLICSPALVYLQWMCSSEVCLKDFFLNSKFLIRYKRFKVAEKQFEFRTLVI